MLFQYHVDTAQNIELIYLNYMNYIDTISSNYKTFYLLSLGYEALELAKTFRKSGSQTISS